MTLALSTALTIVEGIIVVAIVVLLVAVFVLYRRKNGEHPAPNASASQSYYAGVTTLPGANGGTGGTAGTASPAASPSGFGQQAAQPGFAGAAAPGFSGFSAGPQSATDTPQATMTASQATMTAPQATMVPDQPTAGPASPAPGTPAGWLPDPSGVPDTLRYWDGSGWTQHVAQRS